MEKHLLSIVMVLEEFHSMLLGTVLFMYTDHKNLTFTTLNCHHVLFWHLYMEEYCPTILYYSIKKNVIADTFSRLPCYDVLPIPVGENAHVILFNFTSKGLGISDDPYLLDCFLNLPLPDVAENTPVNLMWIYIQQNIGTKLATKAAWYMTNTSINLLMVIQLYVMPSLMRIA